MLKIPEIRAEYDPVLRIKSYEKNTRNSRNFTTLYYESKVMQKAPEIHAKYDPVLRIKSYAKNTRNSRRI